MSARRLFMGLGLAFGVTLRTLSASADSELDALLSESIESTASKSAETSASSPALTLSIRAEDLRRYGIRTLAEAYQFLSVGLVSQDPLGEPEVGSRSVMFANDQGRHVLLLLDGHTLNDQESGASMHGHGLGLPIELIDHVEVVLGPGSVLYGSNAMLGVINVVTLRARRLEGVHAFAEAAFSPPLDRGHDILWPGDKSPYFEHLGAVYRVGVTGGYEFSWAGKSGEITFGAQYLTLSGPSLMWGPQALARINFGPRAEFGVWGGQTTDETYYERTPSGYLRLALGEFEGAVHFVAARHAIPYLPRPLQPPESGDFADPDAHRERYQLGLELSWRHNLSSNASLLTRVYGDLVEQSGQWGYHPYRGCGTGFYGACTKTDSGYARWLGSELQATFDWDGTGSNSTLLGSDVRLSQVGFENGQRVLETGQFNRYANVARTGQAAAIYAQHVYRPAPWATLNAGARWDFDRAFGNRISPRGAVMLSPWAGATAKAIYSEAIRAPTTDERTFRDPQWALPAGHLDAESVRSIEAVLQQRFGAHNVVFGVFRSWWSDMIIAREMQEQLQNVDEGAFIIRQAKRDGLLAQEARYVYRFENVATIDNFGLNASYDSSSLAGRLTYGFNVTSAYSRINTPAGTRLLTITPALYGNARVSYDLLQPLPVLAFALHASGKSLAEAGEDAGFDSLHYAPPALELRTTVTGPIASGLSYRLMMDYSFAGDSPYTAGPYKTIVQGPAPELVPINRATIMLGVQYDLSSGSDEH